MERACCLAYSGNCNNRQKKGRTGWRHLFLPDTVIVVGQRGDPHQGWQHKSQHARLRESNQCLERTSQLLQPEVVGTRSYLVGQNQCASKKEHCESNDFCR